MRRRCEAQGLTVGGYTVGKRTLGVEAYVLFLANTCAGCPFSGRVPIIGPGAQYGLQMIRFDGMEHYTL